MTAFKRPPMSNFGATLFILGTQLSRAYVPTKREKPIITLPIVRVSQEKKYVRD